MMHYYCSSHYTTHATRPTHVVARILVRPRIARVLLRAGLVFAGIDRKHGLLFGALPFLLLAPRTGLFPALICEERPTLRMMAKKGTGGEDVCRYCSR